MCLCRIDDGVNKPVEVLAWKVFRRREADGMLFNGFVQMGDHQVPSNEWVEATTGYVQYRRWNGQKSQYSVGFHGSTRAYAEYVLIGQLAWNQPIAGITYVMLPVVLREILVVGRQVSTFGKTHRTWVAKRMKVLSQLPQPPNALGVLSACRGCRVI